MLQKCNGGQKWVKQKTTELKYTDCLFVCQFGDFFVCLQSAGAAGNVAGAATAKEGGASLRPQSDLGTGALVPKTRRPHVPPPPIMMLSYVTNGNTLSDLPPTKSLSRHAKQ